MKNQPICDVKLKSPNPAYEEEAHDIILGWSGLINRPWGSNRSKIEDVLGKQKQFPLFKTTFLE